MNAAPLRSVPHDPWADIDQDDEGMPSMEARILRSRQSMAILADLPPAPEPVVDEDDQAFGRLLGALLTDDELAVIARQHGRFEREGRL